MSATPLPTAWIPAPLAIAWEVILTPGLVAEYTLAAAWVIGSMVVEPATRISVWEAEFAWFAFTFFDTLVEKVPMMVPTATAPMTATTIRTRVATIGETAISLFMCFRLAIGISPEFCGWRRR